MDGHVWNTHPHSQLNEMNRAHPFLAEGLAVGPSPASCLDGLAYEHLKEIKWSQLPAHILTWSSGSTHWVSGRAAPVLLCPEEKEAEERGRGWMNCPHSPGTLLGQGDGACGLPSSSSPYGSVGQQCVVLESEGKRVMRACCCPASLAWWHTEGAGFQTPGRRASLCRFLPQTCPQCNGTDCSTQRPGLTTQNW